MAARRRVPAFDVDERTEQMSLAALVCRRYAGRHAWMPVPRSARRRAELLDLGQVESVSRCARECGAAVVELFDLEGNLLSRKTEYPREGYLLADKTGGRLPASEARKALFARRLTMV